jgi:hypothetical protein
MSNADFHFFLVVLCLRALLIPQVTDAGLTGWGPVGMPNSEPEPTIASKKEDCRLAMAEIAASSQHCSQQPASNQQLAASSQQPAAHQPTPTAAPGVHLAKIGSQYKVLYSTEP